MEAIPTDVGVVDLSRSMAGALISYPTQQARPFPVKMIARQSSSARCGLRSGGTSRERDCSHDRMSN
jgi:hypothetical protein